MDANISLSVKCGFFNLSAPHEQTTLLRELESKSLAAGFPFIRQAIFHLIKFLHRHSSRAKLKHRSDIKREKCQLGDLLDLLC